MTAATPPPTFPPEMNNYLNYLVLTALFSILRIITFVLSWILKCVSKQILFRTLLAFERKIEIVYNKLKDYRPAIDRQADQKISISGSYMGRGDQNPELGAKLRSRV